MMRLARFIAMAGIASRRRAEQYIVNGLVQVNGTTVTNVATTVDPTRDVVVYLGKRVQPEAHVYYVVHKPVGYVSAARTARNEKLVTDLVPAEPRVYPVGRLDKDSSGLLLLTNDGELAHTIMHPKFTVTKQYLATLDRDCADADIKKLLRGVRLTEGLGKADAVSRRGKGQLLITLHQGWNRQIRRMLGAIGYSVVSLQRVAEGSLKLGNLQPGKYRVIKRKDIGV